MHHKQVDSSTSELTDRAMSWNESGSCKLSDNSSWQDFVDWILNFYTKQCANDGVNDSNERCEYISKFNNALFRHFLMPMSCHDELSESLHEPDSFQLIALSVSSDVEESTCL